MSSQATEPITDQQLAALMEMNELFDHVGESHRAMFFALMRSYLPRIVARIQSAAPVSTVPQIGEQIAPVTEGGRKRG